MMSDTPLCDALARDALDSNDMSAWHSLAYRLEKELARLRVVRPEAERTDPVKVLAQKLMEVDAERYRWIRHDSKDMKVEQRKAEIVEIYMGSALDEHIDKARGAFKPQNERKS